MMIELYHFEIIKRYMKLLRSIHFLFDLLYIYNSKKINSTFKKDHYTKKTILLKYLKI